jgi:hypothetical protein
MNCAPTRRADTQVRPYKIASGLRPHAFFSSLNAFVPNRPSLAIDQFVSAPLVAHIF